MTIDSNTQTYLNVNSFKNHLLIATPRIDDDFFSQSVIYICEHNKDGAMGLTINQPIKNLFVADVLEQIKIQNTASSTLKKVLKGGPVKNERGFVLHNNQDEWESSVQVDDDIYLTTSKDILGAIGEGGGPEKYLFALGFCGWDANQLDEEITNNSWLVIKATDDILFEEDSGSIRKKASQTLNIDLNLLSQSYGCT